MTDQIALEVAADDITVMTDTGVAVAVLDDATWALAPMSLRIGDRIVPMRIRAVGYVGHRPAVWMVPRASDGQTDEQTIAELERLLQLNHLVRLEGLSRPTS